ncbi:MAG: UDP-N-acetylmuramoyl-L-alanine--D-glutamate ligase [Coriobacteriales bacterium]|nr:UDP-N-acetylmuramoyl-L-alanine--D-glutamate ligase [Coriobacteriales bacterium]
MAKSICFLGLGKSNQAAISYFNAHSDLATGLDVYDDTHLVDKNFDIALASPGIAPHTRLYASALERCGEVIGDVELAWRLSPKHWLAITGTNGKTTTTTLTAHLINAAAGQPGRDGQAIAGAHLAGNIGVPVFDVIGSRSQNDWIVCETSSYELYSTKAFRPDAAALLNITPDHISWHRSFEAYATAKRRIFAQQPALRVDLSATAAQQLPSADLIRSATLQIKGPHNFDNAVCAAELAHFVGLTDQQILSGLAAFAPLEHRFEPVATCAGVEYINDSKATNPEATVMALRAFKEPKVVLLAGGRDKNTTLATLCEVAEKVCKSVICYGEAGTRLHEQLPHSVQVATFFEAFTLARQTATAGDTVLLSPACASFDEFSSFEMRGETFKQLVRGL